MLSQLLTLHQQLHRVMHAKLIKSPKMKNDCLSIDY